MMSLKISIDILIWPNKSNHQVSLRLKNHVLFWVLGLCLCTETRWIMWNRYALGSDWNIHFVRTTIKMKRVGFKGKLDFSSNESLYRGTNSILMYERTNASAGWWDNREDKLLRAWHEHEICAPVQILQNQRIKDSSLLLTVLGKCI